MATYNNNDSLKIGEDELEKYQALTSRLWGYVVQGIILVVCNSVIFTSILYHDLLRSKKEYALPALLAFRDFIDGVAAIMAGVGRNWIIWTGQAVDLVSRWHCLITPWGFLWIFGENTTESILLMITIDRLVAVGWPLFHYGLTKSYSNMLILLAVTPAFIGYISASMNTLGNGNASMVSPICYSYFVYNDNYYKVMTFMKAIVALLGVILYIPVIVLYLRHNADLPGVIHEEDIKKYIKSQRKFTVTLGISCLFTTVFYVLPITMTAVVPHIHSTTGKFGLMINTWAYLIVGINKIADVFVYSLRHRNLRLGIKFLFMKKQLTTQAIQNANNDIVPAHEPSPHAPVNNQMAQNHHHINFAVSTSRHPFGHAVTPPGIRRPVIKQRSTRV